MKTNVLVLTILLSLYSCVALNEDSYSGGNNKSNNMPSEPGKCYAKCIIQDDAAEDVFVWKEILCAADITSDLCKSLQQGLIERGYFVGTEGANGVVGNETKSALVKFQKDNGLPAGALDFETLDLLGVKY